MSTPVSGKRAVLGECGWLVLAFVVLALGVAVDHGHYSLRALALVVAGAGLVVVAARGSGRGGEPDDTEVVPPLMNKGGRGESRVSLETLLMGALVFLLVAGVWDSPGYHLEDAGFRQVYIVAQLGLAAGVVAAWRFPRVRTGVVMAGVALGFGLRVGMVISSPAPMIDVFTQFQESAAHLLQGLNPFATPVSDPSGASARFGYEVAGYSYPPANLYAQTGFYFLFGDVRYAHIACEGLALVCLGAIIPRARKAAGGWLVLLFLFQPRGLFVIEQSWNEPLLVGGAGVFLWLAAKRPESRWVAVAFGVFLSLKQYLVFFAALFFARPGRWRLVVPVSAVIAVTWLPFLLWDAGSAVENGMLFQFRTPFRPDGLTVSAAVYEATGWAATKWVAIGAGLAVSVLAAMRFRTGALSGYLYSGVLATWAVFLCGSQAFANYYYFIGAMILFLIALRMREDGDVVA